METTLSTFKCRASASGALMTNPKSKTETLSETTKTYLQTWIKEQIYGHRAQINSKYIDKGIEMEDMAIDKAIEWLDLPFALKNENQYEDDYFTGTPDLLLSDTVIDIKNSWDFSTLPLFEENIPTKGYETQVQIYMHLTGLKKASVIYILLNTPETYNSVEIDYSNVDKKYRYKKFEFEYDIEIIEKLKERVIESRKYINYLCKKFDIQI
jgi:hypothetical protein